MTETDRLQFLQESIKASQTPQEWINTHFSSCDDPESEIQSLLSSLQLLHSDLQAQQSTLSTSLIHTIPELTPSLTLLKRHLAQNSHTHTEPPKRPDVIENLKTLHRVQENLFKTKHILQKTLKWQNVQQDVSLALTKQYYADAAQLLSDALTHCTPSQKETLDPLCDAFCSALKASVHVCVNASDTQKARELCGWFVDIERKKVFEDMYFERWHTYCQVFRKEGFSGVSKCIDQDAFTNTSRLLERMVQELLDVFRKRVEGDKYLFFKEVDAFVLYVGGDGTWALPLLRMFMDHQTPLVCEWTDVQSLCKQADVLLQKCEGFMYGVTLPSLPLVLKPELKSALTFKPSKTDTWERVNDICTAVESYIFFEEWLPGFTHRYHKAMKAPFNPPSAYSFLQAPPKTQLEFDTTSYFEALVEAMQQTLLEPLYTFKQQTQTTNAIVSIPKFSEAPSDKIVHLSEYVLTLPQYLDMYKDRNGFVRLGEEGVMKWTYYVAEKVREVCVGSVDIEYYSNVCRVLGME